MERATYSNRLLGTLSQELLLANTGNRAPNEDPTAMMNIDATRKPKKVSAPPPEPQLRVSSPESDILSTTLEVAEGREGVPTTKEERAVKWIYMMPPRRPVPKRYSFQKQQLSKQICQ